MLTRLTLLSLTIALAGAGFGLTTSAQEDQAADDATSFESQLNEALLALNDQERDREREGDGDGDRERDGDRPRDGDRERDGDRPRDGDRERDGDRPRDGDRERDGDRPRDRDREVERDGDRPRDGERERDGDRDERERDRERDEDAHRNEFRRHVARMRAEIEELAEAGRGDQAERLELELRRNIAEFERGLRDREEHGEREHGERARQEEVRHHVARVRAEIERLVKAGRVEEAERLEVELRDDLKNLEREQRGEREHHEGNPQEHAVEGIHLLHAAAEHLAAAGMHDVAHSIVQRAREIEHHVRESREHEHAEGHDRERGEREHQEERHREEDERHAREREEREHGDRRVDELAEQVESLTDQIAELRQLLRRIAIDEEDEDEGGEEGEEE